MIGDYSVLEKSMNGVKTLSDGISTISNGIATHENIIYNDYIKSEDEKTEILNDTINTENINAENIFGSTINSGDLTSNTLNCNYLYVNDLNNPLQDVMEVNGLTKKLTMYSNSDFRDTVNIINANMVQTQGGTIQQTGTNFNTLKDTKINGFIEVGSNIVQTGGSSTLKDVTCDNITMNSNKGITQSGTSSNTFGSTSITNLTITNSVIFPSQIEMAGTTTTDDIIMNNDSVITQDITVSTNKFNKFRYTKTLDLDVDGNITQTKANASATLKNTIIQGSTTLQGDIEQTAGFTKLNTIECNNITLRENNGLNISGTGKINQIGTGENIMNAISLNNNQNITFNGSGIISQPLNGTNILSHFRGAGFGIIAGRNNTTFSHTQNIQNNNGLQFQYNRDNSSFYSYLLNNRVGSGGGFRFQRYNGGVYVDEPLIIDDNITMNKNLNIVGGSITASSATLGIISQDELNCLDNCNLNIITKFNTLDNQIASLQTTASGVSSNTTGITYNSNTDTTTIDNNLLIPSGKILTLGTTNVNSFITDTNTFITAATNTLQGIVYTSGNDTTAINNNVSITGNLLVQGLDVKAEIDALETSFTTGTLTSTSLTTGTLNVTNQINMTNSVRNSRNINNIGNLNFCDVGAATDINSLAIGINGANAIYNNIRNGGQNQFLGTNADGNRYNNRFIIVPDATAGTYNSTTQFNDVLIASAGLNATHKALNICAQSTTANGVRIAASRTTMTGGSNNFYVDSTGGSILTTQTGVTTINSTGAVSITSTGGNVNITSGANNSVLINSYNTGTEFLKLSNTQFCSEGYTVTRYLDSTGNTNVLAFDVTVNPRFKKQINLSIPLSFGRIFRIDEPVTNATINESVLVVSSVLKNNVAFSNSNAFSSNYSVTLQANQPGTFEYEYHFYAGNINFTLTPTFDSTTTVYKILFSYMGSHTWTTNTMLGFTSLNTYIRLNTSQTSVFINRLSTLPVWTGIPAFVAYSNTASYYVDPAPSTNNFLSINQLLVVNRILTSDVSCNNVTATGSITATGNITTNGSITATGTITTSSMSVNNITSRLQSAVVNPNTYTPGFIITSSLSGYFLNNMCPLLASCKVLASDDDGFIVYPGYKLVIYRYANYIILPGNRPWAGADDFSSQTRTIDNTTGTTPVIFGSSNDLYGGANQVQSCRLYYGSTELTLNYIS